MTFKVGDKVRFRPGAEVEDSQIRGRDLSKVMTVVRVVRDCLVLDIDKILFRTCHVMHVPALELLAEAGK